MTYVQTFVTMAVGDGWMCSMFLLVPRLVVAVDDGDGVADADGLCVARSRPALEARPRIVKREHSLSVKTTAICESIALATCVKRANFKSKTRKTTQKL